MVKDKTHSKSEAGSEKLVSRSASAFEQLAGALQIITAAAPPRMSLRQAFAFTIIAQLNAMGRTPTLTEVREIAGDVLGQGIERQIRTLFVPSKRDPDGLGWVEQVPDENDLRFKFLRLTERGRYVVNEITGALTA